MFTAHILAHSLAVSIVRMAKEINNLEKNAEEFGDEGEKREERPHIRGLSASRPPSKRRKEMLDEKKSCGNSVPPNAIYTMFDEYKAKFVAYSPPCKVIRNPGNLDLCILESWVLKSGIQLKESRIPLTTGSGIQLLESGVQSLESKTYMGRGVC